MSYLWAKLWIEMIDDRKTASLPDSSWRRFVECILLAMEVNQGGRLPSVADMAWRLRITPETMADDMTRLALSGLVELDTDDTWKVTNFVKRQAAIPVAERVANHRERQKRNNPPSGNANVTQETPDSNEHVTDRYTDKIRIDQKRGEKNARATQSQPEKQEIPPPPPPIVKSQPIDRTPEGFRGKNGYRPPDEPPEPPPPEPEFEKAVVAEMSAAITEVTGVDYKLNWTDKDGHGVGDLAWHLLSCGYTADQVRQHYGAQKIAERWHWYESDWRGKRGDKPRLKEIRETIAGAVADHPGKPQKDDGSQSWIEQTLRLARANGLIPQP